MPSKLTEELIKLDHEHVIHSVWPFKERPRDAIFEEGHGVMLRDTEGREYIDGSSQLVNVNLGHGRREIIEAVLEQIKKLQYTHTFWGFSNTAVIKCSQKLAELTPPGLDHFFFTSGGSESIETAVRIARLYWNSQGKSKTKIIGLHGSFHGVSGSAVAATSVGNKSFQYGFGPVAPGFLHIPSYYCYRCAFKLEYPSCGILCAQFLAETIEKEGAETVAAFLAEPEQGSFGFVSPPPEYWPMVREICDKYNVLLIDDEVMSGFCRTGKMFTAEHWNLKPDMITMAKGITSGYFPFGATALSDKVWGGLPKGTMFTHGFTYSGHPVGAAASIATMEAYLKEKIAENATKVGEHLMKRLRTECEPLPHVGNIGGLGLMIGVELVKDKKTKALFSTDVIEELQTKARQKGLIIRFMPRNGRIQISPPLIITVKEMDQLLDILLPLIAEL